MWSIHAFNDDGTLKLCIGAAITIVSAASASSTRMSDRAITRASSRDSYCAGRTRPDANAASGCGNGFRARSRVTTFVPGAPATMSSTNRRAIRSEIDSAPRGLDNTSKRWFIIVPFRGEIRGSVALRKADSDPSGPEDIDFP
jgi:hypothetical protein